MIELGGNISLTGFNDFDSGTMVVVKKIVGMYGKKYSDICKDFENLSLTVKTIHQREKSEIYEVHGKLTCKGNIANSEIEERNLFVAIDTVLKKIEHQIMH